tara:strand:- start:38 stop:217 length:180 start_codon:yes stop_codon:yes gene_type:complete
MKIAIVGLIVFILAGTGWVKNIIKLSECDFEAPYKAEVIRVIGVIPPVGAVVGWIDLGK